MRRCVVFAIVCLFAVAAFGEDPLSPAEYLKILAGSKLKYTIVAEPAKNPVPDVACPRRDERTRLVMKDGARTLVAWNVSLDVLKLFAEGERHFEADRYDEAAEKYKAGLAIDPQAIAGYFFYGDTLLFGKKDPAAALAEYQKGIALDPTMPTGHFFASTAYARMGQPDKAREEIVKALTYHPPYEGIWQIASQSPQVWKAKPLVRHKFELPAGYLGVRKGDQIEVFGGKDGQWYGYALCKAVWANEARFSKQHSKEGTWSLEEERACVLNQMFAAYNMTEAKLEKGAKKDRMAVHAALPPLEKHLYDVAAAKLLDGYILFEIVGQKCPLAMSMLDETQVAQVAEYIRRYLIVAAE